MRLAFSLFLLLIGIEYIGLGRYFPVIKTVHLSAALGLSLFIYSLVKNGYGTILQHSQTKLLTIFLLFTAISVFYAVVQMRAYYEFRTHLGYFILFVSGFYLLNNQKNFNTFVLLFIAFHIFVVLNNIEKLGDISRIGKFNGPYFFRDGNDLAWGINLVLPLTLYVISAYRNYIIKLFGIISFVLFIFAIMGTQSRGGVFGIHCIHWLFRFYIEKKDSYFICTLIHPNTRRIICSGKLHRKNRIYQDLPDRLFCKVSNSCVESSNPNGN